MRILIFGGTGSLGYKLNERFLLPNLAHEVWNYSRDECKHWQMKLDFNNNAKQHFVIGDIINKELVEQSVVRLKPDIVIIAAAMKHLDQCENNIEACINNNLLGIKNIADSAEKSTSVKTVVFISTDKACSPVNAYGMCKALGERIMLERSLHDRSTKYVSVRYGNVLNSRGSILPILHNIGRDKSKKEFTLTHTSMTRFIMTLDQSIDLIIHAIKEGRTGEIIIPQLHSMRIKDLVELFADKYKKNIRLTGLRVGEKLSESLINETQSMMLRQVDGYYHIMSPYDSSLVLNEKIMRDYNSLNCNILTKESLLQCLVNLGLFD